MKTKLGLALKNSKLEDIATKNLNFSQNEKKTVNNRKGVKYGRKIKQFNIHANEGYKGRERENGAEINIEKQYFFLKFMLIRFIDTKSLSNTKLKNSKEIRFKYTKLKFMKTFN